MNTSRGACAAPQTGRAAVGCDGHRPGSQVSPQTRGAFERALQSRRGDAGEAQAGSDDDDADNHPGTPMALCPPQSGPLAPRPVAVPTGAAPGAVDTATLCTRMAAQAALHAGTAMPVLPTTGAAPAGLWEVTLGGGLQGLPMQLRAERPATLDGPAAWSLTIGTTPAQADALKGQAARLAERLRRQGVEVDHVRIESSDREAPHERG